MDIDSNKTLLFSVIKLTVEKLVGINMAFESICAVFLKS